MRRKGEVNKMVNLDKHISKTSKQKICQVTTVLISVIGQEAVINICELLQLLIPYFLCLQPELQIVRVLYLVE